MMRHRDLPCVHATDQGPSASASVTHGRLEPLLTQPRAPEGPDLNSDLARALDRAKYIYVTTYSRAGRAGTVPTWLWHRDGVVYFTTRRQSLKARRIRDNGRVSVHVGTKDGPEFEGRAEWVDDRPDLEAGLLAAYRRKYRLLVPLWMGRRIRRGLAARTSVLVRITPSPSG